MALLIGTDSNAHSTVWGCSNKQDSACKRGPKILEFLNNNDLFIENDTNCDTPTFDSPVGRSNIDLTITNKQANKLLSGISGNERADKLAKLATSNESIIHKLKISVNSVIIELKENLYKEHLNRLNKENISDKAKLPMLQMLKKYKYKIDIPKRKNLMMVTQILTGTSILNYSRSVRKKERNPFCSYCKNIRETSEHFLTTCIKSVNARIHCFGRQIITMKEIIMDRNINDLINYIKDSNRFNDKFPV